MRSGRIAIGVAGLLSLAVSPFVLADGEEFVALKIEAGEELSYRVLSVSEVEELKASLLEEFEAMRKAWREGHEAGDPEPAKPKFSNIGRTFATEEEAEAGWRADADRNAFFECWRCEGAGEVDSLRSALGGSSAPGKRLGMGGGTRNGGGRGR